MYETRNPRLLQDMFDQYEYLIQRPYLADLSCLPLCTPPNCYESIQVLKICSLPETARFGYFSYIINALASLEKTIGCILVSTCDDLSLYLCVKDCSDTAISLLQNGLLQTFPDIQICALQQSDEFLDTLFNPTAYSLLSSSLVTLNTSYDSIFLKDFTNLVGKCSKYVAFFLAEPVKRCILQDVQHKLYEIYDELSNCSQSTYTNYQSDAKTTSHSTAKGNTNSSSQSLTHTCSESNATSHNSYVNVSASTPLSLSFVQGKPRRPYQTLPNNTISPAKTTLPNTITSTNTTTQSVNLSTTTSSSSCSSPHSNSKNINSTFLINKAQGSCCTLSNSEAKGQNCSESNSLTSTDGHTMSHTDYYALSFSRPNKRLQEAVSNLNEALTRYNTLSRNATFNFGAYFFSCSSEMSLRSAYSYTGLSQSSYVLSPNIVNSWASNHYDYASLYRYLRSFTHPEFTLPNTNLSVFNSTLLLSNELVNTFYLPIT